jgi:hypothetical protein
MDLKMKYEITNLIKHGIPEDVATISVCLKYDKKYLVEDLIEERRQEQELMKEEIEKFVEFSKSGEEYKEDKEENYKRKYLYLEEK